MRSVLRRRLILFSLCGLLALPGAPCSVAQGAETFRFEVKPGPYEVGLKVVEQYDSSRVFRTLDALGKPFTGNRSRPLQTVIWYPAIAADAHRMTLQDYVQLLPTETDFEHPKKWSLWNDFVAGMKPTLTQSMWAVRDAKPTIGHFPVVIYSPSINGMSWENADLCELLASHGYVVIATPDLGTTTREMTHDLAGIDAVARDISFLIGYAQTLPDADMSKVAVAAFSWGGLANIFAAARDNRIRAMVELDGSLRYFPGLIKSAGYIHPEQMTIPMLFLSHGELSLEEIEKQQEINPNRLGPDVLNQWTHGDLITVNMRGMIHAEFCSMYQRNENFWKFYRNAHVADYTREDGTTGYAWISRYVLAFLDSYFKNDSNAIAFLGNAPANNGVPPHFISVQTRKAIGLSPTFDTFQKEVARRGFSEISSVYEQIKQKNDQFKPSAPELSAWAEELNNSGHFLDAIPVLKFNIRINPDAIRDYSALGDAYVGSGQRELAIQNYKLALEKDAMDNTSAQKLQSMTK